MGFYDFPPVSGPLCVGTMGFQVFFAVCRAPVYGNFEILRFSPVCGPCVGDFEIFKKISNREKSQVWGSEMAVTQRKKRWQSNPSDLLYII